MSSHSHGSSGSGRSSVFSTAHAWLATKQPEKLNPLSSLVRVGHNTVDAVIGTTTKYVADILDPAWAAIKNAGNIVNPSAYRANGIKNIPKSLSGIVSNTTTAAANIITGIPRGIDHLYTHGVTNSIVDLSSGTADRVPLIGKFSGNLMKMANSILAGPIRFLGRVIPEKSIDKVLDAWNAVGTSKSSSRRLTTSSAAGSASASDAHHH